ncbi:hypothetical protein F383_28202 [Gossypium arboreum]|uniref:Uncharacterized protein n=1 Tax=Gossypium arboreum TaxID=29729 RepID=A0A0B0MRN9_GOSAR|nr:hypothetical protein F383_28202 [Gossypium arboreum]
MKVLLEEK